MPSKSTPFSPQAKGLPNVRVAQLSTNGAPPSSPPQGLPEPCSFSCRSESARHEGPLPPGPRVHGSCVGCDPWTSLRDTAPLRSGLHASHGGAFWTGGPGLGVPSHDTSAEAGAAAWSVSCQQPASKETL